MKILTHVLSTAAISAFLFTGCVESLTGGGTPSAGEVQTELAENFTTGGATATVTVAEATDNILQDDDARITLHNINFDLLEGVVDEDEFGASLKLRQTLKRSEDSEGFESLALFPTQAANIAYEISLFAEEVLSHVAPGTPLANIVALVGPLLGKPVYVKIVDLVDTKAPAMVKFELGDLFDYKITLFNQGNDSTTYITSLTMEMTDDRGDVKVWPSQFDFADESDDDHPPSAVEFNFAFDASAEETVQSIEIEMNFDEEAVDSPTAGTIYFKRVDEDTVYVDGGVYFSLFSSEEDADGPELLEGDGIFAFDGMGMISLPAVVQNLYIVDDTTATTVDSATDSWPTLMRGIIVGIFQNLGNECVDILGFIEIEVPEEFCTPENTDFIDSFLSQLETFAEASCDDPDEDLIELCQVVSFLEYNNPIYLYDDVVVGFALSDADDAYAPFLGLGLEDTLAVEQSARNINPSEIAAINLDADEVTEVITEAMIDVTLNL